MERKLWHWLALAIALAAIGALSGSETRGLAEMINPPPKHYAKILTRAGAIVAAPLVAGQIEFTSTVNVPGLLQDTGACTIHLLDERDPAHAIVRDTYGLLAKRQRIEIYPSLDLNTDPEWTGVITALPDDLEGQPLIQGKGILDELERRKLRRYHRLNDTAPNLIRDLIKTYNVIFQDDFNRVTLGADWTAISGSWQTYYEADKRLTYVVGPSTNGAVVEATAGYSAAQWQNAKIGFKLWPVLRTDSKITFTRTGSNSLILIMHASIDYGVLNFRLYHDSEIAGNLLAQRHYPMDGWDGANHLGAYHAFELYTIVEGASRRIVVIMNGYELFNVLDTDRHSGTGTIRFTADSGSFIDDFVFYTKTAALTAGTLDTSSLNVDQTFIGDSHKTALDWIAQHRDWDYRVRPKAGWGADLLDMGANIGFDYSAAPNQIILEEGKNIFGLRVDSSADDLATSVKVFGQNQDDATANYVSDNLTGFTAHGVIEAEYSDERVNDVDIARVLGDKYLADVSQGKVSVSGRILDEAALFERDTARWASAIAGRDTWGGGTLRYRFRSGDYVWVRSPRLRLDQRMRIVARTRRDGDIGADVVFDYFAFRKQARTLVAQQQLSQAIRSLLNRMNSRTRWMEFTATGTQDWNFGLRGQIQSTFITIKVTSGAPTYKVLIDGVDRTLVLFGSASIAGGSVDATDTQYLIMTGSHQLSINVTAGAGIFDIEVNPKALS